jgi:hypothetical protein
MPLVPLGFCLPVRYIHVAMRPYRAAFRCIAGCPGEYPLDEVIYRCPTCSNLLEVNHDMAALKQRSPLEWVKTLY